MPTETQVLAFDVYGTLLDTSAMSTEISRLHPEVSKAIADKLCIAWRRHQLEYTLRLNSMGIYEPFDTVTERALLHAIAEYGDQYLENDVDRLMDAYNELQPYAGETDTPRLDIDAVHRFYGVQSALEAISEIPNVKIVVFSNGTRKPQMISSALQAANLMEHVDEVFIVDAVRMYKPAKQVYEGLVDYINRDNDQLAGISASPDRIWLVSGNPFDVTGARNAGLNAIWVNRSFSQGWIDHAVDLKPSRVVHDIGGGREGAQGTALRQRGGKVGSAIRSALSDLTTNLRPSEWKENCVQ
ncbi:hypothetical protein NM688_g4472 [Phlebia brevispora]|uniref:Uncharacterized protein n=1 Tax=Phlebia brevispora TaxID=194682 RepID=A0ACC1T2J2_9APHY|nr:hypothetical protein NM688_g4472 [Phlebia brevispora]